jgi:hypothetical protein
LAVCTIDADASPQFQKLRDHWRRSYPHIDTDLEAAFKSIRQNIQACGAWRIQAGAVIEAYKYRQNSKDIKRGASYGWRIIALFHKPTAVMYPILVYPKTAWENAGDAAISAAVKEMQRILGYCIADGCDGVMTHGAPLEQKREGDLVHTKMQCRKCGSVQWVSA